MLHDGAPHLHELLPARDLARTRCLGPGGHDLDLGRTPGDDRRGAPAAFARAAPR